MTDYSEVYLEINKTLKSYYNYELKGNHEQAVKAAENIATLAIKLKDVTRAKV